MELFVSADVLIRLFLFLLYVPVCLFAYWKLIPRLSPTAKHLASGFLAAQVLVIVVSLELQPNSFIEEWLWHLDREWNIPSAIASLQLALVGGVALVTAWLARTKPAWLYLVGIGLVFLFLGLDEFFSWKTYIWDWKQRYMLTGVALVAATVAVAVRSARHTWKWHLCLLIGLSLMALGAMGVDDLPQNCRNLGFLHINGCLQFYVLEECLEFLGSWLTLLAILGHFSNAAPRPLPRFRRLLYTFPALWILLLIYANPVYSIEPRLPAQPTSIQFESGVHVYSYQRETKDLFFHLDVWMYVSKKAIASGVGYSVHLVDQVSGDSIASRDEYASRWDDFEIAQSYGRIYRQRIALEIPPQTPVNRAFWIVLTLWRKQGDEFVRQRVIASDLQLLDDTQVVLDELVLPAVSTAAPPATPIALFDNGFMLDAVDLPERAQPGETLNIPFAWHSDIHGQEDYAQFLHLGHEESGDWWVYDQPPLGPRLPTRLWYNGLADSEVWRVPLPADLASGRYAVFTGLYRARDLERLPVSDANGNPWLDARVPLGSLMIEK